MQKHQTECEFQLCGYLWYIYIIYTPQDNDYEEGGGGGGGLVGGLGCPHQSYPFVIIDLLFTHALEVHLEE